MSITIRSAQTIRNGVRLQGNSVPPIIIDGLILWLDAANPDSYQPGYESWIDLTANHYDAGLYGSAFEAGWDGKSLDFANNNYAQIAPANMFNGDMTAIGWVYVRSYASWSRLFDFGNGSGGDNVLIAVTGGPGGYPVLFANGGNLGSSTLMPLNQWAQLAATQSGTTQTLYLNGQQVGQQTGGPEASVTRNLNYIGRSNWGSDAYLDGKISQLRMYNRALTSAEILTDYAGITARLG
jgi:hypothetical protein